MLRTRKIRRCAYRSLDHHAWRVLSRASLRALPSYCRGPDELSQAMEAFARAIRCHRRLARLAPRFFDSAVVDREVLERADRRRWMESWEPLLEKYYGPAPASERRADPLSEPPPLPGSRTQRAVQREMASWNFWLAAGGCAMSRYRQRRPHAIPSLCQLARLLRLALELGRLACGLDTARPRPESASPPENVAADLKRACGEESPFVRPQRASPPVAAAPPPAPVPLLAPEPPLPKPPPKCDALAVPLLRLPNGLLSLEWARARPAW